MMAAVEGNHAAQSLDVGVTGRSLHAMKGTTDSAPTMKKPCHALPIASTVPITFWPATLYASDE